MASSCPTRRPIVKSRRDVRIAPLRSDRTMCGRWTLCMSSWRRATSCAPDGRSFSWISLVIDSRFSYRGENVVAALDRHFREIGYSKLISVENESEFFSRNFCRSGRPDENSFIGALNSKLRSECLNLPDACEKLEAWRAYCQEERLHRYLGISPDHAGKLSRLKQPD